MKQFAIATCLALVTATACAHQHAPTASLESSRGAATDSHLSPVYTDGKCHFRLKIVPGQGYADRGYMFYANNTDNPVGWGFGFGCNAGASQDEIDGLLDAKQVDGKWIWGSTGQPFAPEQHFTAYHFTGKNWKGIAIAYDMTTGEEATRQRLFGFCLMETNGPQILCGGAQLRSLDAPPATSTRPKIMAVLKTIEFVDSPTSQSATSSTATGH